jgi:hypothetical protein
MHDVFMADHSRRQDICHPATEGAQPQSEAQRRRPTQRLGRSLQTTRSEQLRRQRRIRLIDEDLRLHGSLGIRALLDGLELDYGIQDLDRRLEHLIDADPRALGLLEAAR